jgi:hypothetical protein
MAERGFARSWGKTARQGFQRTINGRKRPVMLQAIELFLLSPHSSARITDFFILTMRSK